MKKLLAAILLLVYFTVSTGFVVSVHYCMNKIDAVVLGENHQEECGKCGMLVADSMGCCKNDVKVVKLKVDQAITNAAVTSFAFAATLPPQSDYYLYPVAVGETEKYPVAHGPPLSKQNTYLKNCVFRL